MHLLEVAVVVVTLTKQEHDAHVAAAQTQKLVTEKDGVLEEAGLHILNHQVVEALESWCREERAQRKLREGAASEILEIGLVEFAHERGLGTASGREDGVLLRTHSDLNILNNYIMECLRPVTLSVSRLRSEDIRRLPAAATNLKITGCSAQEWTDVLAALRDQFKELTHLHLENMAPGDKLTEELLAKGALQLVELHLIKLKLSKDGMQSIAICNLSKLLTLSLSN